MDEETKLNISRLYVDNPNIKFLDASNKTGVPPTKIYDHLARVRHKNKPQITQKEYLILLEKERSPYSSPDEIAKELDLKTSHIMAVLLKHGYSGALEADSPKHIRLKDIIRKLYDADPNFPENDICLYVGSDVHPRDIRKALVAVRFETNKKLNTTPVVTFKIAGEARRKAIATYLIRHPHASYDEIGKKFKISTLTVSEDIRALSAQLHVQQSEAYELHRHRISTEIDKIKKASMKRFNASPKSSSRFLEIYLSAVEKETKLHGLNAPERKQVQIDSTVQTKEDRDAVMEAYYTAREHDTQHDPMIGIGCDYDDVSDE